jgi:rfaE bifunctional protein kinase chain/domain
VSVGRLRSIVSGFAGRRVLVVGDMVADEYVVGTPARISREAPVLVLQHTEEFLRPGGAANVAHNLAALGADARVAGVIGDDSRGAGLRELLSAAGIDAAGLIVDGSRCTATKTRIVGRGTQEMQQQIVRIDRVNRVEIDAPVADRLLSVIDGQMGGLDALIISDYENGVISPHVIERVVPGACGRGLAVVVDSHGDLFRFKGVTGATPNQPEAEATLGRRIEDNASLEEAGEDLRREMDAEGVLLTRGNQGMTLFERGQRPRHLTPTNVREVFDPTGAGDTASAVFTLALVAGASMAEAALLSNMASGEVVRKLGAATIDRAGLCEAVERQS